MKHNFSPSQQDLESTWGETRFQDLPAPCQGVPMSIEDYDYKAYWVKRWEQNSQDSKPSEIVYLVYYEGNSKIGLTRGDIKKRLSTLRTGKTSPVVLCTTYSPNNISYREMERRLHKTYNSTALGGEWFSGVIPDKDFLDNCLRLDK